MVLSAQNNDLQTLSVREQFFADSNLIAQNPLSANDAQFTPKKPNAFDLNDSSNQGLMASGLVGGVDGNSILDITGSDQQNEEKKKRNTAQRTAQAIQQQIEDINQQIWDIDLRLNEISERRTEIAVRQNEISERLDEIGNETSDLQTQDDNLEAQSESLETQAEAIIDENDDIQAEIEQAELQKDRAIRQLIGSDSQESITTHTQAIELTDAEIQANEAILRGNAVRLKEIESHQEQIAAGREQIATRLESLEQESQELLAEQQALTAEDANLETEQAELETQRAELQNKLNKLNLEREGLQHQDDLFARTAETLNSLDEEKLKNGEYTNQEIYDQLPEEMKPYADKFITETVQSREWLAEFRPELLQSDVARTAENDVLVKAGIKEATDAPQMSYMHDGDTTHLANQNPINGIASSAVDSGIEAETKLSGAFSPAAQGVTPVAQSPTQVMPTNTITAGELHNTAPAI